MADGIVSIVHSSIPAPSTVYGTVTNAVGSASSSAAWAQASSTSVTSIPGPTAWSVDSTAQRSFLRSVNAGVYIGAVLLGVHTITFGRALVASWRAERLGRRVMFLLIASVLYAMANVYEICNIVFTVNSWVIGEGSSGTSYTYFIDNQNSGLEIAATVAVLISTVLTDGFLYVRCAALWSTLWVTVPLGLLTLVTYALDIMQACWTATPGNDNSLWQIPLFSQLTISVALAQSLHVIFTVLSVYRLVTKRDLFGQLVGIKGMAIESALTYGVVSVVFLATYCAQNMAANAFLPIVVQIQGIVVDMILARCYRGERTPVVRPWAVAPATIVQLPVPVQASSEASSVTYDEKLALAMMTSKWDHEIDRKEPVPPEYSV
ncbi:uncharacterized protein C8Q71DRAFT_787296 [Rhodofomes roseus]|uniref:Uncharacterized protein n=1 Tax=Rhodofomes roseus TaxID=34475 RepID=A0A4Y9Y9D6_9APHY|nr:uncharacterized protein C8Q71DRAFT_787296 [Rhodofomes roseus]KAH9830104.1 hypothetical protein C8Q71DRAFT_787296 [Rhodofomes roseus]TFY58935.1 hypothetical protein EVJ58_g6096 [Rhodofomes roseus]